MPEMEELTAMKVLKFIKRLFFGVLLGVAVETLCEQLYEWGWFSGGSLEQSLLIFLIIIVVACTYLILTKDKP